MAKTLHFRSLGAYHRWLAFDKMHVKRKGGKKPKVMIAGRPHRVRRGGK